MSHISEGLLHAHLDGAVGQDRAEQWLLAEAHLSVCEDCRRRLEEARQLRDAAGEILAVASAPSASKPDFQELVAKAGNAAPLPRRKSWWNSTSRLAWAASLMLAVGAGWLGRELLIQTGQDMPAVVAESEAIPQAPEPTAGFRDAVEQDEAATLQGRGRAESGDGELSAVEQEARGVAAPPPGEPEVAMMQKSEGQKATEEFRQDAAPLEAKTDRLEAVAERRNESDVMARAIRVGPALPTCFVAEKDQDRAPLRTAHLRSFSYWRTGRLWLMRVERKCTAPGWKYRVTPFRCYLGVEKSAWNCGSSGRRPGCWEPSVKVLATRLQSMQTRGWVAPLS